MVDEQRSDEVAPDVDADEEPQRDPPDVEANLRSGSTWMRLVFMLLFAAIYGVTRALVFVLVIVQFFWVLFTGQPHGRLRSLGHAFALYTAEIVDYLSFYMDDKPFPFERDFPTDD